MVQLKLVARLFDRGPYVRSGTALGANAKVFLSGKVAASQGTGTVFAAAAVPVVVHEGRLVPGNSNGEPSTIEVARLYEVQVDGSMAFQLEAEASWWTGVEGVLMALLYDLDMGQGTFGMLEWSAPVLKEARAKLLELLAEDREALDRGVVRIRLADAPQASSQAARSAFPANAPPVEETVFAVASCQYPAGMIDRDVAHASYRRLAERLQSRAGHKARPDFLLLLGDQIYADATAGLFDPTARFDRFERPHDVFQELLTHLNIGSLARIYMMLDDHEIEDNWEPPPGGGTDPLLVEAREHYIRQRRLFGPDLLPAAGDYQPLWYPIASEAVPFFVADTRTEREARKAATIESARIMRQEQLEALQAWLRAQPPDRPKFIASGSILLPRRLRAVRSHPAAALRSDAWDGYPASLHRLLAFIADHQIRNVVFLSGEEHLSCVARARIQPPGGRPAATIHSVHSSPLHAPFPFANSVAADLAMHDRFAFSEGDFRRSEEGGSRAYVCTVETTLAAPGDGFAVLRVAQDQGRWSVRCEFDRAEGVTPIDITL